MVSILNFLGHHATVFMASGVFVGLALQPLAAASKPLLMPTVWALLAMSMMRLELSAFRAVFRRPMRLVLVLVFMLAFTPVAMWLIVADLPLADGIKAALVMGAGSAPLMSTPAFGLILGLDAALILAILVVATFLIPITLPIVVLALLGLDLETGMGELMLRLGGMVGTAAIAAALARRVIGRQWIDEARLPLDGFAVLRLVLFAIPLMDGLTARFLTEPGYVLMLIGVSFAVYIGLMVAGALVFWIVWRDKHAAWSAGLTSGCRNLAIIIAVLPASADPEIITYFALAQFPIYIMPMVLGIVMNRNLR